MRFLAALLVVLLLAGCSSPDGGSTTADLPEGGPDDGDERTSEADQGPDLSVPGTPTTTTHDGTLAWGVRPPLTVALSGPHEQFEGTVVDLQVPGDVTALLLELTWGGGAAARPVLVLRALSGTDSYFYGSGGGTPEGPAWVIITDPEPDYGVTAIADLAEADVDWTLHATEFRGGGVPDGFTAVA